MGPRSASSGVQVPAAILDDIKRRPAGGAHYAVQLPAADQAAYEALGCPPVSPAEREVPDAVRLEVIGPVIARQASVAPSFGHVLNPRICVVIGVIDCLGE